MVPTIQGAMFPTVKGTWMRWPCTTWWNRSDCNCNKFPEDLVEETG